VGLATWFMRHGTERRNIFLEEGGLVRAWNETLSFLQSNDLLNNVIYVDLLNEYPNWHGYDWLKNKLNNLADLKQYRLDYRKVYAGLLNYWKENKESLIKWMDGRISDIAGTAAKYNLVCGNTEGWGPITWFDHPELDWKWVKESAEICVNLALKHDNYKFICTSNFTHPQFRGMWEDIRWHKQITSKIKA